MLYCIQQLWLLLEQSLVLRRGSALRPMLILPRYLRHVLLRQASRTATSESLGACRLQLACFSSVMLGDRQFFLVLVANFLQTAIADVLKQYLAHWTRGIEIFCQQLVALLQKM